VACKETLPGLPNPFGDHSMKLLFQQKILRKSFVYEKIRRIRDYPGKYIGQRGVQEEMPNLICVNRGWDHV
jgi:hypothetical protein